MSESDQVDEVSAMVNALAAVDAELSAFVAEAPALAERCEYASRVINQAVAVILELHETDTLQTAMIALLEGLHACAIDDRDAARAALSIAVGAGG